MDGPAMSGREQRILAEIETELRVDGALDRRLSRLRMGWWRRFWLACGQVRASMVALLVGCSLVLVAVAAQAGTVSVAVVFAVVWVATLLALAGLLGRCQERRRERRRRSG